MEKEKIVAKDEMLEKAMKTLENFVIRLSVEAGETEAYGIKLWNGIKRTGGILQELAYYHDYGNFLCQYKVAGYTLADILVWQVDHFKAYLDRPAEMNRYRKEKLVLAAFEIMVQMEENPQPYIDKMSNETGTDFEGKY